MLLCAVCCRQEYLLAALVVVGVCACPWSNVNVVVVVLEIHVTTTETDLVSIIGAKLAPIKVDIVSCQSSNLYSPH